MAKASVKKTSVKRNTGTAAKSAARKTSNSKAAKQTGKATAKKTLPSTVQLDVQLGASRDGVPSNKRLQTWARAAYEVHHAAHSVGRKHTVPPVQVSVRMVGSAESRKLNREWRDEDHATNVLSFPAGETIDVDGQLPSLGDLAICVPVVKREAKQQGKSLDAHWAHMMIHGVLHLLGYDHEVDRDALVMEACEIAILESFGFANPYEAAVG